MKTLYVMLAASFALSACTPTVPPPAPVEEPKAEEPAPAPKPAEPGETAVAKLAWEGKHADAKKWTEFVLKEIPIRMADAVASVPKDVKAFCPNYAKLSKDKRVEFYAQLISRMTKFESNFKPETKYVECVDARKSGAAKVYGKSGKLFPDRGPAGEYCIPGSSKDGGVAISRGLGQMSLQSALSYNCDVSEPQDLHDPYKNLSCMMRVMNRFIPAPRQYEGKVRGHGSIAGYDATNERWMGASAYWSVMRDLKGKDSYPNIVSYLKDLSICRI